jgi:hypothetical protein
VRVSREFHHVSDSTSLQAALDASLPYDAIILANGVYASSGQLQDGTNAFVVAQDVTLIGEENGLRCAAAGGAAVIDGQDTMRCVYVTSGSLVNVTLQNGCASGAGAAGMGGGAMCTDGGGLERCIIHACRARTGGGACLRNSATLTSCLIVSNSAESAGGVHLSTGCTAYNLTVVDNVAVDGAGGVHVEGGALWNSIVYHNSAPGGTNTTTSSGTVRHCCTVPAVGGTGNIVDQPALLPDFSIDLGSPCVDMGATSEWMTWSQDLAGAARVQGASVDIGAFEAIPEPCGGMAAVFALLWVARRMKLRG